MEIQSKRAEYLAIAGLILGVIFFGVTFVLGRWSDTAAIRSLSWLVLANTLVWLALLILFHQRSLAEQEKLDTARLTAEPSGSTIFEAEQDRSGMFTVARRRLESLEKWFVPIFAGLLAALELGIGLYVIYAAAPEYPAQPNEPLAAAVYMVAIAFVSFLISRYATGMSHVEGWRPLRAGAGYLCAVALLSFAIAIALALAAFKFVAPLSVLAWVVPVLLVVLGLEGSLNILLEIYRPRIPGRIRRYSFDSRLLSLINEPGGVLRTAAGAIDYQFGFEVSQTWFYKLVEKAVVPLVLFGAVTLYLLSCIVVINPGEQAVIEHFGRPVASSAGNTFGPGLIVKWPWPVDIAYVHPTEQIQQLNVGFVPEDDPEKAGRPLLWQISHYKEEYNLLVAAETGEPGGEESVPVSIVRAAVPVQYRIRDLYAFLYNHSDAEKLLEAICYRELMQLTASAQLETGTGVFAGRAGAGSEKSLLGAGRAQAAAELIRRIQKSADEKRLGVEIVFVGLQGVHPPPDVAEDYQNVVAAVQQRQASILGAMAEKNDMLGSLAGSVEQAEELYELAADYQALEEENDSEAIRGAGEKLDAAFVAARGDIFARLRNAKSYAFEKQILARATGDRFIQQLKAFNAAGDIYSHAVQMDTLETSLKNVRKYVVAADPNDEQILIFDVKQKSVPSLFDITGAEIPK